MSRRTVYLLSALIVAIVVEVGTAVTISNKPESRSDELTDLARGLLKSGEVGSPGADSLPLRYPSAQQLLDQGTYATRKDGFLDEVTSAGLPGTVGVVESRAVVDRANELCHLFQSQNQAQVGSYRWVSAISSVQNATGLARKESEQFVEAATFWYCPEYYGFGYEGN